MNRDLARRLRELADRARRLPPPNHRRPEAFHEARDELGKEISEIADLMDPQRRAHR